MGLGCLSVLLAMAVILSGCDGRTETDPNQGDLSFDKDLDSFVQRNMTGGYLIEGPGQQRTLVDVTNIKLLYANYKSSQRLRAAIERFDRSSAVLGTRMLVLTIVIGTLTFFQGILTFVQVSERIRPPILRLYERVSSLVRHHLQCLAKFKKRTTPPVEQDEKSEVRQNGTRGSSEESQNQEPGANR